MRTDNVASFLTVLQKGGFLEPNQLAEAQKLVQQGLDLKGVARELVKRGWLTVYQVNHVLNGQAALYLLAGLVALATLGRRARPGSYPRASKRVRMPLA